MRRLSVWRPVTPGHGVAALPVDDFAESDEDGDDDEGVTLDPSPSGPAGPSGTRTAAAFDARAALIKARVVQTAAANAANAAPDTAEYWTQFIERPVSIRHMLLEELRAAERGAAPSDKYEAYMLAAQLAATMLSRAVRARRTAVLAKKSARLDVPVPDDAPEEYASLFDEAHTPNMRKAPQLGTRQRSRQGLTGSRKD